jgi:hypothetical protein
MKHERRHYRDVNKMVDAGESVPMDWQARAHWSQQLMRVAARIAARDQIPKKLFVHTAADLYDAAIKDPFADFEGS